MNNSQKLQRHYGSKMFRERGEKAAMQLRSQAAKREMSRHCEGGNSLPTEAIRLINNIFGKITPTPLPVKNLFPYSPIHLLPSKRVAFTLAEVLITLGIIGVVAAITLPTIIQNQKRAELQNRLKVGYSILQQALTAMNSDLGYLPLPEHFPSRTFKDEYIKYFDNPYDCFMGGVYKTGNEKLCGKGSGEQIANEYYIYSKKTKMSSKLIDDGQFVLKNGMLVMIENYSDRNIILITIDVNGIGKKPNTWGQDVFTFQLVSSGKLLPAGAPGTSYTDMNTYCSKTSSNIYNGVACTYKAINEIDYWNDI